VSAAVSRPGFRLAPDLAPGTYTTASGRPTPYRPIPGRPRLWWSRPMPADGCSVVARMPRYAPAASGTRSAQRIPANGQNGSSRHMPVSSSTRSERNNRKNCGLLIRGFGVQVPGGAPARSDLGFYDSRSFFMCPVCPGSPPVLAPCLLVGRMLGPGVARPFPEDWSRPPNRSPFWGGYGVRQPQVASRGRACAVVLVPGGHGIGRGLRTPIRSSGTGAACGSRVAAPGGSRSGGILDLGGQRLRPPRSIVGTRGVHFRPGQPVRGLAGVQWDTARSGLDGRRNPGRTVRRQTGLRADGGFAQGRRAQDWAGSLEDGEDPGDGGSLCRSAACAPPWYQHRFSTPCPR
jgi:hypothetical protein